MEDETSDNAPPPSSLVPVAIALFGVVLGAVAIYFSLSGQGKTGEVESRLISKLESHAQSKTEVDKALADLSRRIDILAEADSTKASQMRNLTDQVQTAFDRLRTSMETTNRQVVENRNNLNDLSEALGKMAAAREAPAAPTATASAPASSGGSDGPSTGETVHVIRSGDTFARLASEYRVSLGAIIDANPEVNPNRLQIGQKVIIPTRD